MIESEWRAGAVHIADVTDPRAVADDGGATVARFGRLDILVNNAAVTRRDPVRRASASRTGAACSRSCSTALSSAPQAALPTWSGPAAGTIINIGGLTAHKGRG